MTTKLKPRAGFDWAHVAWGAPDAPRSALCSYCSASIPDADVPLIFWKEDGCRREWWGMEDFDD